MPVNIHSEPSVHCFSLIALGTRTHPHRISLLDRYRLQAIRIGSPANPLYSHIHIIGGQKISHLLLLLWNGKGEGEREKKRMSKKLAASVSFTNSMFLSVCEYVWVTVKLCYVFQIYLCKCSNAKFRRNSEDAYRWNAQ